MRRYASTGDEASGLRSVRLREALHPDWLRECPRHKAVLLPMRKDEHMKTIRACPVCVHLAHVKVMLAVRPTRGKRELNDRALPR